MELQVKELLIKTAGLEKSAQILRVLNHHRRQTILRLIHKKGEMTVTQIYTAMQMKQSYASQDLSFLRKCGFVSSTRQGKLMLYQVNEDRLQQVQQISAKLLNDLN